METVEAFSSRIIKSSKLKFLFKEKKPLKQKNM